MLWSAGQVGGHGVAWFLLETAERVEVNTPGVALFLLRLYSPGVTWFLGTARGGINSPGFYGYCCGTLKVWS